MKKLVAVILCFAIATAVLTGCAGGRQSDMQNDSSQTVNADSDDKHISPDEMTGDELAEYIVNVYAYWLHNSSAENADWGNWSEDRFYKWIVIDAANYQYSEGNDYYDWLRSHGWSDGGDAGTPDKYVQVPSAEIDTQVERYFKGAGEKLKTFSFYNKDTDSYTILWMDGLGGAFGPLKIESYSIRDNIFTADCTNTDGTELYGRFTLVVEMLGGDNFNVIEYTNESYFPPYPPYNPA